MSQTLQVPTPICLGTEYTPRKLENNQLAHVSGLTFGHCRYLFAQVLIRKGFLEEVEKSVAAVGWWVCQVEQLGEEWGQWVKWEQAVGWHREGVAAPGQGQASHHESAEEASVQGQESSSARGALLLVSL